MRRSVVLAVLGTLGACGDGEGDDGADSIVVHAPAQALAMFEDGAWTPIVTNADGNAAIRPAGPFVLAGLCLDSGNQPQVQVVMASPADGNTVNVPCPAATAPRATLNIEIVGGGVASIYIGHHDTEVANISGSDSVDVPAGLVDVVAWERNTGRTDTFVIARDLELIAGQERPLRIDFSAPARMSERVVEGGDQVGARFELVTANHTRVELPARFDNGPARIFDREELVDGDRQILTGHVLAEGGGASMSRIRADRDSAPIALPPPTTEILLLPTMTLSGSRIDATWASAGFWTYRRFSAIGTASWTVTMLAGWSLADPAHDRSLDMPDLAGHPQWAERYAIRSEALGGGSIELFRPLDAVSDVGISASVAPQ